MSYSVSLARCQTAEEGAEQALLANGRIEGSLRVPTALLVVISGANRHSESLMLAGIAQISATTVLSTG